MSTDTDDWASAMAEQAIEEAKAVELDEFSNDGAPLSEEEASKLDAIMCSSSDLI
ncbi:hypothetical protein TUM4438_38230 [Shewanella sairae]|uniref:Uncharacterized protein n=1 Tax=Shewanella sairae TaxID=190310 RepID=A0ABQ4PPQ4_9GAMM|nr:hypothetical protein TUM4438_38230 [Shewanella sairae]